LMPIMLVCDRPGCGAVAPVLGVHEDGRVRVSSLWWVMPRAGDQSPAVACCLAHASQANVLELPALMLELNIGQGDDA
jgi:hypothetical protein